MLRPLFAAVAVLGMAIASPAFAQPSRHVYLTRGDVYQVDFRDLDLTNRDDRSELMGRIVYASRLMCSQDEDMTRGELKRCIRASTANALENAPAPVQVALRDEPVFELAQR